MTKCTDCGAYVTEWDYVRSGRKLCPEHMKLRSLLLTHALQHGAVDTRRIVEEVLRAVEGKQ